MLRRQKLPQDPNGMDRLRIAFTFFQTIGDPAVAVNLPARVRADVEAFATSWNSICHCSGIEMNSLFYLHGDDRVNGFAPAPELLSNALAYLDILRTLVEDKTRRYETPEFETKTAQRTGLGWLKSYDKPVTEIQWLVKSAAWLIKACDGDAERFRALLDEPIVTSEPLSTPVFGGPLRLQRAGQVVLHTTLRQLLLGDDVVAAHRAMEKVRSRPEASLAPGIADL